MFLAGLVVGLLLGAIFGAFAVIALALGIANNQNKQEREENEQ